MEEPTLACDGWNPWVTVHDHSLGEHGLLMTNDCSTKKYRIHCLYKNWIGKPDPSGFGKFYVYSDDPSWLHGESMRRERWGDKVLATEKNMDGEGDWRKI